MLSGVAVISFYAAIVYGDPNLVALIFTIEIPLRVLIQYLIFPHLQPVAGNTLDVIGAAFVTAAVVARPLRDATQSCNQFEYQNK